MRWGPADRTYPLVAFAGVVAFRAWLAVGAANPHLYPDEAGYLGAARLLAGAGPDFALGAAPRYHPLYSVLVAPVFWLADAPGAFTGVLAVNAALGGVTAVLLYRCCRVVLDAGPGPSLAATLVVSVFAGHSVMTTVAWAENVLPACVLLWVLAVHRATQRRTAGAAAAAAVAALACYWAHPRGLLVVAVTAVAALAAAVAVRGRHRMVAGATALGAVAGAIASRAAVVAVVDPLYTSGGARLQEGGTLDRLLEPGEWGAVAERVLGQAWYQAVAPAGLVVIGAIAIVGAAWRRRVAADIAPVLVLAAAAGLALAAAAFLGTGRADGLFYGRYVDAVTPLVAAAGVVALLASWRAALTGAVAVAALTALMGAAVPMPGGDRPLVDDMVLGISGHIELVGVRYAAVAALALALLVAAAVAASRHAVAAAVVLALGLGSLAVQARHGRVDTFIRYGSTLDDFAATVAGHAGGAPVGVVLGEDPAGYGYQWFEPAWRTYAVDRRLVAPLRGDWLVGPLRWPAATARRATLVAAEPSRASGLWVLPGEDARDLRARGAVLPARFPVRFDDAQTRSALATRLEGDLLVVTVTHRGEGTRWPHHDPDGAAQATGRIRVGVQAGRELAIADLATDLLPGEQATVEVDLGRLKRRLGPGRHRLTVDLFQVGYGWFRERGHDAVEVTLTV